MNKRSFLGGMAAIALLAATGASAQSGADVQRISNYLNGLTTMEGSFIQTNPDGSISEGKFYIRKPGLMRFEYAPPNPAVVVSDGTWVAVVDRASNAGAQRYPLGETPLDLILRDRVDLAREGAVQSVEREGGQLRVRALDPDAPRKGDITMVFSDNPLELRQWIVRDENGGITTVVLSEMRRGVQLERSLFSIESAEMDRKGR
ncbi:LolA family protein [Paroceanicella profunda]|nr:outer membrane lipoprotein carrier protein LolA [Paroceanicella profunda]